MIEVKGRLKQTLLACTRIEELLKKYNYNDTVISLPDEAF